MAIGGSGDYVTKLKENLSCPVCYEVFTRKERIPKGLPCYHSMCLSCLAGFVKKSLQENYLCPLCQAKFTVPAGGVSCLPTNTGLTGMLDLLPPQEESTPVEEPAVEKSTQTSHQDACVKLSELGNVGSNTVNMYMMLNDVSDFINGELNSTRCSQYWYVKGVPWKVLAQIELPADDDVEFTDKTDPVIWIGVACDSKGKDWQYTTTLKMRLYNYDTGSFETHVKVDKHDFNADGNAWGWDFFSKKSLLKLVNNKYVKNNSLMVLVELTVH